MKTLIIVRHGKSSWDDPGLSDQNRPLKDRGINDSTRMAAKLKDAGLMPEIILASPAKRALHTAEIFAGTLGYPLDELSISETLYFSGPDAILALMRKTPDEISRLMIVGHNPDFTEIVNIFVANPLYNLPTAGVAILEFNAESWKDISKKNLKMDTYQFPKSS